MACLKMLDPAYPLYPVFDAADFAVPDASATLSWSIWAVPAASSSCGARVCSTHLDSDRCKFCTTTRWMVMVSALGAGAGVAPTKVTSGSGWSGGTTSPWSSCWVSTSSTLGFFCFMSALVSSCHFFFCCLLDMCLGSSGQMGLDFFSCSASTGTSPPS